jgi:hypothetical protein
MVHVLDVPGAPTIDQWSTLPSSVERNFRTMLALFAEHGVLVHRQTSDGFLCDIR